MISILSLLAVASILLSYKEVVARFHYCNKSYRNLDIHSSQLNILTMKRKIFMNQNHYFDADMKRTNVIVGLNPALQRIIQLSSSNLEPGEVHRASNVQIGIGE